MENSLDVSRSKNDKYTFEEGVESPHCAGVVYMLPKV